MGVSALFNLPLSSGAIPIYDFVTGLLGNTDTAWFIVELVVEIIDKTISLVLAAGAAVIFTGLFEGEMTRE